METKNIEYRTLRLSVLGALLFAVIGIILGIVANSQMIFFDGIYSLVSLGLSFLSLRALIYMEKEETNKFQFGKDIIEPLVILFKSFVILVMCIYAVVVSLEDIFNGGRSVHIENALGYAFLSTFLCLLFYLKLRKKEKICPSELLKVESSQWFMDTLLSLAVLIGFIIAFFMKKTNYAYLTPYVDPFLVLVTSLYFVKTPLVTIKENIKELLGMPPSREIEKGIKSIIHDIKLKYFIEESYVRISKVGRVIFIEIDFVLGKKTKVKHVKDFDCIREEIDTQLESIKYEKWLTVSFTENRKWAV
ncbi:cation diffusion facilitator family transporter [Natronincola ferrireducens]|uniref:Cation diffusion facilitator family transporter n=1 Tax=Natronincola ferrireducens TaxID=393762 RepID=A0A1G9FVB9_9FIRM|nr:cation diffusion facilitator family transporter [Natronincola ferrireducens]SDK92344.1 cation diffusion facilitator family transporter [Natronincola ferrireducens]